MKILTEDLKRVVKVLSKAAGLNNLRPFTCLLFIKAKEGKVSFMTTDEINTLYATIQAEGDLEITVDVTLFSKLINTLEEEWVELNVENKVLIIKCGGTYKIPTVLNSSGEFIRFKDLRKEFEGTKVDNNFKEIKKILDPSRGDDLFPIECYRNFYFGNQTLTTNTITASKINKRIFPINKLLFPKTVELLTYLDDRLEYDDHNFRDKEFWLIYKENKSIDDYQYLDVINLFDINKEFKIINVKKVKGILNKFSVFNYDKIVFHNNYIKSEKEDIIEELDIDLNCHLVLKVDLLKKFLNSVKSEDVEIYGTDEFLVIRDGEIEHIITKIV